MKYFQKLKKFLSFFPNFLESYKWPLVSGCFFGMSFIPYPLITTFFALVPLWFFVFKAKSFKRVTIGALSCQFVAAFIGFHWIIYTAQVFGNLNFISSLIVLIGFLVIGNVFILMASWFSFFFLRKFKSLPIYVRLLIFPLSFSFLHFYIPTIFPWNMGYHLLFSGLPALQTAEVWGFRFIDTLFYMYMLLSMILCYHTKIKWSKIFFLKIPFQFDKVAWVCLSVFVFSFLSLNLFGLYLKKRLPTPDGKLTALLVQNNIGSVYAQKRKNPKFHAWLKTRSLTRKAVRHAKLKRNLKPKDIDFILWSEATHPFTIPKNTEEEKYLSSLSSSLGIPIITGASTSDRKRRSYNSIVMLDRQGQLLKPYYDKIKLLIFGEYFPGLNRFPFLRKIAPYFGNSLTPGKDLVVQDLEGVALASQICYEGLFDSLSRDLALKKAQVFINVSNDSWYNSYQPLQHLVMNLSRAIETRRPVIRNTNTGLSTVIQADGTVENLSPRNKPWFELYEVSYYKNPPKTLFLSWGYYINDIFYILLALFIGFFLIKKKEGL